MDNTDFNIACTSPARDGSLMALVDCDTFYASCERVCRPDLLGKPVVVLSNNDGCIVARSREAKQLGIPMGEPEFQVRDLLRKHNVAVFSSNYALYGDLSRRVMQTVTSVMPDIEIYSIDEAFVPLRDSLAANADDAAREVRNRVWRWVGLPVSIGIAPTRVLAKIAVKVAKKNPACDGVFNICHCDSIEKLLASIPVGDLWGIGRHGSLKLRSIGINTALKLRDADPTLIHRLLTVTGLNVLLELRGIQAIKEDIPATHVTIISSRSLGRKVTDLETMSEAIAFHAARAAEKLRLKKLVAGVVCAGIQTAYYSKEQPQHDEIGMIHLPMPSMDSARIIGAAHEVLRRIFRYGYSYAKAMVMLTDLSNPHKGQYRLIPPDCETAEKLAKREKLMEVMDKINNVEGRGTLVFAAQGPKDATWHMNRHKLSPAWTTDMKQLLHAVCR